MATAAINPHAFPDKSPIVAAYLRAFKLDREHEDTSSDEPDAQFAYAAMQGATDRALECGIHSIDHVALAALLSFDAIDSVISGLSVFRDGERVIPVADAISGFANVRTALKHIWDYASEQADLPREDWMPVVKFYGADKV